MRRFAKLPSRYICCRGRMASYRYFSPILADHVCLRASHFIQMLRLAARAAFELWQTLFSWHGRETRATTGVIDRSPLTPEGEGRTARLQPSRCLAERTFPE